MRPAPGQTGQAGPNRALSPARLAAAVLVAIGVLGIAQLRVSTMSSVTGNLDAPQPLDSGLVKRLTGIEHLIRDQQRRMDANHRSIMNLLSADRLPRAQNRASAGTSTDPDEADPLEYSNGYRVEGFPSKPLSLEDAQVCNPTINIVLDGHWKCPEDPTCKACKPKQMERYYELVGILDSPEYKESRMAMLRQKFGDGGNPAERKVIVVSAVNMGQLYLFLNWACSCELIGLDPRSFTIVVPTDDEAAAALEKAGFTIIPPDWTRKLSRGITSSYRGAANVGGHADINNVLLIVANDVLSGLRHNIILHDVDIAWITDIREYLVNAGKRRDILGMSAPFWKAKGGVNTGFVYLRYNERTTIFMETLKNIAAVKKDSDQELFNIMLRHREFTQLAYRILPQNVFYKYSGRRAKRPGPEAMLYHAVGNHKRFSFIFHGQWSFNETCSVYDAEIDRKALEMVHDDKA